MSRPSITIQHGAIVITDVDETGRRVSIVLATLPVAVDFARRLRSVIETQADLLVASSEQP